MALLPKSFHFSAKITIFCLILAAVMVRCSFWQWERYLWKKELVESYSKIDALADRSSLAPFPIDKTSASDFKPLLYKVVRLRGSYDFAHQVIILNQEGVVGPTAGPGFLLLTPFKLEGSEQHVIVSRGFIPFVDDSPDKWQKYSMPEDEIAAVVQPTVPSRPLVASEKASSKDAQGLTRKWLYPDLETLAPQLPFPTLSSVFLQRVGPPPKGAFPAEAISVKVPPSTHFGYTIEWALLASVTLIVGFLLQAFPRKRRR